VCVCVCVCLVFSSSFPGIGVREIAADWVFLSHDLEEDLSVLV
jgi:hypothetical protein